MFIEAATPPEEIGKKLEEVCHPTPLRLKMISNRGTQVFPPTGALTDCVDHFRCRFIARSENADLSDEDILDLVRRISTQYRWMHVEKLQEFDGAMGFTKAQGED